MKIAMISILLLLVCVIHIIFKIIVLIWYIKFYILICYLM